MPLHPLSGAAVASIVIVSPALREANNGNWQTARRWRQHLAARHHVRIVSQWPDARAAGDTLMIALHARRSAAAIAAWAQTHPQRALAVVLTGTDLYRDILTDAAAQQSLVSAQVLVGLQGCAPQALPAALRDKMRVIWQSTPTRSAVQKTDRHLRALMVGHLRDEKSPQTLFAAARLLADHADIRIDHIGAPLDPALGEAARQTMRAVPSYRWLGELPHEMVRRRIARAHLLVHASRMEGGAHVIMEAVCSDTPVIASRIDGNVGMLGADYGGYFSVDRADELAALILRCRESNLSRHGTLASLREQCRLRAPLFAPAAEQAALFDLVNVLQRGK